MIVGGAVRDLFLGKTPKDIDLATAAEPMDVANVLRTSPEHGFTFKEIGDSLSHGVSIVEQLDDGDFIEVATFRTESPAGDGRHAVVQYTGDLNADLARRDFTINAMAVDPMTFTVIDPFGGLTDIENRKIRAVGDPAVRFAEDNLRALRMLRFVDKLGFSVDPETLTAATDVLRNAGFTTFNAVSTERIAQEVLQMSTFQSFSRGAALAVFAYRVMPGLAERMSRDLKGNNKSSKNFVDFETAFTVMRAHDPLTVPTLMRADPAAVQAFTFRLGQRTVSFGDEHLTWSQVCDLAKNVRSIAVAQAKTNNNPDLRTVGDSAVADFVRTVVRNAMPTL